MTVKDKVVLVTGASAGIGLAAANGIGMSRGKGKQAG